MRPRLAGLDWVAAQHGIRLAPRPTTEQTETVDHNDNNSGGGGGQVGE